MDAIVAENKSLWQMFGENNPDEFHYQCSIEPDSCYKWRGWKEEFDAIEADLRQQIEEELRIMWGLNG